MMRECSGLDMWTLRALRRLALTIIVAFAPSQLTAQAVVPEVGEEVRVVQRGQRGAIQGLFVEATSVVIVLSIDDDQEILEIPRANITGLSVQRGYRHQKLKGALFGIGAGVLGGVIVGQKTDAFSGTGTAVGASVAVGLPLGLLVGWLARSPEWDGVTLSALGGRPY
jgi:hypothetical protein